MAMAAAEESFVERGLFGGAITCCIPANFYDVSNIREVPNNQEAYVDPNRDESIIMELLEFKTDVADERSSLWFLQDLAIEQGSEQTLVVEPENGITTADVPNLEASIPVNVTVGTLAVAKARQGDDARNLVRVHLANIRLRGVETDVLITVYEPLIINERSQSAAVVGAGTTVPAALAGCMAAPDVLKLVLSTFRICDWSLFGAHGCPTNTHWPQPQICGGEATDDARGFIRLSFCHKGSSLSRKLVKFVHGFLTM